jgi:hypothetical protein
MRFRPPGDGRSTNQLEQYAYVEQAQWASAAIVSNSP